MVIWCTFSFSNPQRTSERLSACSPLIFPSRVFNCQVAYYGPIANLRSSLSNLGFACPEGTPLPELLLDLLEMPADESVRPAHSEKLEKLKKLSEPWMKEGMPRCIINFVPPNFLTNSMNQRKALNVRACIIREDVSISLLLVSMYKCIQYTYVVTRLMCIEQRSAELYAILIFRPWRLP